jgi:autotransporter-associated beta strand protein
MKTILNVRLMFALLAIALPQAAMSTVFFTDDFNNGSTLNGPTLVPGGTPTASFTSYQLAATKDATNATIAPNFLSLHLVAATTSGFWEVQALFTTNPVVLSAAGDYIAIALVFTNSSNSLAAGSTSPIWLGLYNSGSSPDNTYFPVANGALDNSGLNNTAASPYATGYCEPWAGYIGTFFSGAGSLIATRPVQNGPTYTSSQNQDLVGNNISTSTAFGNPTGTKFTAGTSESFTLASNAPSTVYLNITLDPAGSGNYIISNALFMGAGTGGTLLTSSSATTTSNTFLTTAFDGLAFGAANKVTSPSYNPQMDVSSITITGQSTAPTNPPTITTEPSPVSVVSGGSCAFIVAARGENVTYQWHRNGTNLVDGGNISGSATSTLAISPAGAADVFSGANGYYVTVSGAGGYSTNSTTNSLALITATSLFWSGANSTWDVNNTVSWKDSNGSPQVFNFGDPVTFDNSGGGGTVNLTGPYLSAASVTVSAANVALTYIFSSSGSFAGPGSLIYTGACQLTLDNANTYSGGTTISNAEAYLYLADYAGLGTGPVTLALAGGVMEIVPSGNTGVGINGDIVVADNFEIQVDSSGNYGAVFLGDLSGTTNKTLTFTPGSTNNAQCRIRVYGANTVYNANLDLNANNFLFAPYEASGSQTYNGVISGSGAVMQKGSTITYLNNQNTYTGGTYIPAGTTGFGSSSIGNVTSGPIGTGPLYLAVDSTTSTTGTGQVLASGGPQTIANPIQYPTGTNNLTWVISGSNDLTFTGPYTLNGNDLSNTFTSRNIQVTNTGLTTISGVISDAGLGCSLNMTGPGVLAINNTETYTGATTVSNGTLQVDGHLAAASAVTVNSNGVLAGIGTIGGAVTVQSGGGVAPGDQGGIGTLTVTNTLTLQSGSSNIIAINATANTHDVVAASTINYGGTLFATNLSGTPSAGSTYTIFSAGTKNGNFSSVTGSPGAGLSWSFNPTTGVLSVVAVVNTNPTSIIFSVSETMSATNLVLSWPTDHIGWTLQSETNLSSNNWANVAGSAQTNLVAIPVNSAGDEFFRLVYFP